MDFSVSYHPISPKQMEQWYFNVFEDLGEANDLVVHIPKEQLKHNTQEELERFYKEKYLGMIKRSRTLDYDDFNRWHGYFLGVIQGFFEKFFFVQGSAVSAIHDKEFHKKYFTPWSEVVPSEYIEELRADSRLHGAFCAGAYMSATNVKELLDDYKSDPYIQELLQDQFPKQRVEVFIKVLEYARENDQGLLEASRVIEQSDGVFEEPSCYSNLFNCDIFSSVVYTNELAEHYEEIYKGTGE
jgi:hypothetical protein